MNPLKRLAGQTAIYGLSSIIGRLLNYLLVPLYTRVLIPSEYGIYTEMFAWVSIIWVFLTYGMETTFFRFSESEKDGERVYSTSLLSLFATSAIFLLLILGNTGNVAEWMGYADRSHYIVYFGLILSLDAMTAIPFARLRQQNRPIRFATIKLINIGINIGLNLFFVLLCPYLLNHYPNAEITGLISGFFNPNDLVGYIFISLLIASIVTLILLMPDMRLKQYSFDLKIWKRMLAYTWPLMIVAVAGSINLSLDKILLKMLLPGNSEAEIMAQVGIYGACYKVSIIMTLFIQTFRYAADPFFFAEAKKSESKQIYADVLKYFTIVAALVFLTTTLYLDVVIKFIGVDYRAGRNVVPILLMGNLFLGIFYNLSFWYKLTNRTIFGALFSVIGAAITIALNVILIPTIGYYGSAWAAFTAYFVMMILSYLIGKKYFPVPYQIPKIIFYLLLSVAIFLISINLGFDEGILKYIVNSFLLLVFLSLVLFTEKRSLRSLIKKGKHH